jgi:hypothetical protein
MLLRLVLAMLTVTGPIPVRVCTCAAAVSIRLSANTPAAEPPAAESKGCACKHRTQEAEGAPAGASENAPRGDSRKNAEYPAKPSHDKDCPAVSPRPTVSATAPSPATDAPSDADAVLHFVGDEPSLSGPRHTALQTPAHHSRTTLPLYLSFLSIRI